MKTMTCKQMGGPCDFPFHGNTADEVIKAEDKHLKEVVAKGDETHKNALKLMQDRWNNPLSGWRWYMNTRKTFAALPEDK
jgi:predicted small metal-binding protein